jgi:hypothetical protein
MPSSVLLGLQQERGNKKQTKKLSNRVIQSLVAKLQRNVKAVIWSRKCKQALVQFTTVSKFQASQTFNLDFFFAVVEPS